MGWQLKGAYAFVQEAPHGESIQRLILIGAQPGVLPVGGHDHAHSLQPAPAHSQRHEIRRATYVTIYQHGQEMALAAGQQWPQ